MGRIAKAAAVGAGAGLVLVTIFAVGEMLGSPDAPALPVVIVLALAMGGLLVGAPAGAVIGGLIGLFLRGRAKDGAPASVTEPTTGGRVVADRPHRQPQAHEQVDDPAPLAPISAPPARPASPAVDPRDPERLNRVLAELDGLPGLEAVAEQVRRMARRVALDQERKVRGMAVAESGYHAIFSGPPGTGKTTVARIWGNALVAMGALPSGHVVEADRGRLVGQHVGETAIKTTEAFDEARGGVLFIDEAYSLVPRGFESSNDFGREAVETVLARMENDRATTAVIAAGYAEEMDRFLDSNPGLRSRFANTVTFEHFDGPTLVRVAESMAEKGDYGWDPEALRLLGQAFTRLAAAPPKGWANARSVRSVLDLAVTAQADRLSEIGFGDDDLARLIEEDARTALQRLYPQAI